MDWDLLLLFLSFPMTTSVVLCSFYPVLVLGVWWDCLSWYTLIFRKRLLCESIARTEISSTYAEKGLWPSGMHLRIVPFPNRAQYLWLSFCLVICIISCGPSSVFLLSCLQSVIFPSIQIYWEILNLIHTGCKGYGQLRNISGKLRHKVWGKRVCDNTWRVFIRLHPLHGYCNLFNVVSFFDVFSWRTHL